MIGREPVVISAISRQFGEAFQSYWLGYLVVAIVAAIFARYIIIPFMVWIFRYVQTIATWFVVNVLKVILIIVDLIFVWMIRLFRIKRMPAALDFDVQKLSIVLGRRIVSRKAIFEWLKRHNKKAIAALAAGLVVLFVFGDMYRLHEKWKVSGEVYQVYRESVEEIQQFLERNGSSALVLDQEPETNTIYVQLKEGEPYGNIRSDGNLDAQEIGVIKAGEFLEFLNEEKFDGKRTWYKVRSIEGQEGWVSSVISIKVEHPQTIP